jgi:exosortase/archaeosortase family protein
VIAICLALSANQAVNAVFEALVRDVVGPAAVRLLRALGSSATLAGNVIHGASSGAVVHVTRACDGHGLMAAMIAILIAWKPPALSWSRILLLASAGIAIIVLFNVIRIAVLFGLRGGASEPYEIAHQIAFPIASVWLVGAIVAAAAARSTSVFLTMREGVLLCAALIPATALWVVFQPWLVVHFFAPLVSSVGQIAGPEGIGTISHRDGGSFIDTLLVARREPLGLLSLPFDVSPYFLPVPIAIAALVAARRLRSASLLTLPCVLALGVAAAILAEVSAITRAAQAASIATLAIPAGAGTVTLAPVELPGPGAIGWIDAIRNVLVHFNLFVFPLAMFSLARPSAPATPEVLAPAPRPARTR